MTEEALTAAIDRLAEVVATLDRHVERRAVEIARDRVRRAEAEAATAAAQAAYWRRLAEQLQGGSQRPRMLDASSHTGRGADGAQRPSERAAGGSAALANSVGCKVTDALVFLEASPAVLEGFAELWRGEIRPWLAGELDHAIGG